MFLEFGIDDLLEIMEDRNIKLIGVKKKWVDLR